jgi:hypothetical protein
MKLLRDNDFWAGFFLYLALDEFFHTLRSDDSDHEQDCS